MTWILFTYAFIIKNFAERFQENAYVYRFFFFFYPTMAREEQKYNTFKTS